MRLLLPLVLMRLSLAFLVGPTTTEFSTCSSTSLNLDLQSSSRLFAPSVYDTIQSGQIAVLPNYLPAPEVQALRSDAQSIHASNHFSTDALASYGNSGKFDPSKDRAVLKLTQWKDRFIGNWEIRQRFGQRLASIRSDLAYHLNRPQLDQGLAITEFGNGSTEISYTRFGPGAFLKRHVDEHHEELKGRAGWSQPTRRSISWLIYLNDDWNARSSDGGQLRCFQRRVAPSLQVGARLNGDLQIGWLRATALDPMERPVFLDGRQDEAGKCAMYIVGSEGGLQYITRQFDASLFLYISDDGAMIKRLLMDRHDLAERFRLIEPPKSKLTEFLSGGYDGSGQAPAVDEELEEVDPISGTLVMFDSVSLPHEVLATKSRERWATSGWWHEEQQPPRSISNLV